MELYVEQVSDTKLPIGKIGLEKCGAPSVLVFLEVVGLNKITGSHTPTYYRKNFLVSQMTTNKLMLRLDIIIPTLPFIEHNIKSVTMPDASSK